MKRKKKRLEKEKKKRPLSIVAAAKQLFKTFQFAMEQFENDPFSFSL